MRPVPRSRHHVAVAIFVAVAALYGYLAWVDYRLHDEQIHVATSALKRHQPALLGNDLIYGRTDMWRAHPPMMVAVLDTILAPTHYRDLILPFRLLVGPLTLVYLLGMYALLRRQCRSWSVSAFVAVLSATVTKGLGDARWGIGSLSSITPGGLCLALMPMLLLAFLKFADRRRILFVFAAVGALGNLHMPSAMNLGVVLLVAYLVRRRFALGAWPMAVGGALCAAAAAAPYAWYYWVLRDAIDLSVVAGFASNGAAGESLASFVLYPVSKLLKSALNFVLLLAAPVVICRLVLSKVERFRVRDLGVWLPLGLTAVAAALLVYGGVYALSIFTGLPGPTAGALLASGLIMPPVYALLAQAITNLFRMLQTHRGLVRWGCVVLAALWMIPSDNLRVVRHAVAEAATVFRDDADKPEYVKRHREADKEHDELVRMAQWARWSSRPDAVFISGRIEFRMRARRSLLVAEDDMSYTYLLAPQQTVRWSRWANRQHLLQYGGQAGDPKALKDLIAGLLGGGAFRTASEWFVVLPATRQVQDEGIREVEPKGRWGDCYRLYRLE